MTFNITKLNIEELWSLYSDIIKQLKLTGAIRTMNITAERGEQLSINYYNKTPNLPNLQAAPQGTKNIDAISRNGDRYSIKTIKLPGKTTGVFWGLGTKEQENKEKKFEYLLIVLINDFYELEEILELDWNTFLKFKKWHSTMKAFNISVTSKVIEKSRVIFTKS